MDVLSHLEQELGGRWTGVTLHHDGVPTENPVAHEMRLCAAVLRSFSESFVLPTRYINCPGARRSLALENGEEELVQKVARESGITPAKVRRAVDDTPHLSRPPTAVALGRQDSPDVFLGYLRPDATMRLVRRWQQIHGSGPNIVLSSFMAVCGNVVVGAYESLGLCLSFGCPDSRKYAGIEGDLLVAGMSNRLGNCLFE